MDTEIKKKRGRKPKIHTFEQQPEVLQEKKKRGRKKKYEIENFEKILHRDSENNFNHNVVYSDDENTISEDSCVKKISFGNLDITVSKRIENEDISQFKLKTRATSAILINQDEYSSDEDKEVPVESFMESYSENKKYIPKIVSECNNVVESLKNIKIFTTTKSQVKESTEWPDSCDVCCWWCCHPFKGVPCTLPTKYDSHRKRFTFCGLFCSWGCVKAYNFDRSDHKKFECSSLISLLLQQLYGSAVAIRVKPAPPRQCLKMFGGYLDIDSFRSPCIDIDGYHLNLVKFNYIYPEITEVRNVKMGKQEKKNLRLFRPKDA
jgi:hypothetical protein